MVKHTVAVLFYKYFIYDSTMFQKFQDIYIIKLYEHQSLLGKRLGLRGRVLLSCEGINGTVSARDSHTLDMYISAMTSLDLLRDFGLSQEEDESLRELLRNLYTDIDWKKSTVDDSTPEPFPDLKISIVAEIVSTGGAIKVSEIPLYGGTRLNPRDFHETIASEKNVVLIDVRNTFEYNIGHFINPHTGKAAVNPQMVSFSSFDSTFLSKHAEELKGKKVLMYCTGGIRCEKASAMLKKRGVEDVSHLEGGIHRYMEMYNSDNGFFKGKNFVFDQRVAINGLMSNNDNNAVANVVGRCVECSSLFDEVSGSRICTVCRDLVLVCTLCQRKLREYHCDRHSSWKRCYFTFLEIFSKAELMAQLHQLCEIRTTLMPGSNSRNIRRTLIRQIEKVREQIEKMSQGLVVADTNAPRRCRTCMEADYICDGNCFGFWKHRQIGDDVALKLAAPQEIAIGDRVKPGPNWNPLRLGTQVDSNGDTKLGTVVDIKSWASEGDDFDCVAVLWDDCRSNQSEEIYRWGFVARNGLRMYDVQKA